MNPHAHWQTGTQIVYRETWRGKVWTAMPVTVVQDTVDLIVLYLRAGTRWMLPEGDDFLSLLQAGDWRLREVTARKDNLYLVPPGRAYAVRTMGGLRERELTGWYVNLQAPVRRAAQGFDTMDHALDIVIAPDLSEWTRHDDEELARACEMGLFSAQLVSRIREEGQRIVERLEAGSFSITCGWERWHASAEWTVPDLPEGWTSV